MVLPDNPYTRGMIAKVSHIVSFEEIAGEPHAAVAEAPSVRAEEHVAKPVERAARPVEHVAKPVEHVAKPVGARRQACRACRQTGEHVAKPVEHVAKPGEHVAKPVEHVPSRRARRHACRAAEGQRPRYR